MDAVALRDAVFGAAWMAAVYLVYSMLKLAELQARETRRIDVRVRPAEEHGTPRTPRPS